MCWDVPGYALERQSLSKYGTYSGVDGVKVPAWLIVDGADALAEGIAQMADRMGADSTAVAARGGRRFRQLRYRTTATTATTARSSLLPPN